MPVIYRDPKLLASLPGFSDRDKPADWPASRMCQFASDPPRSTGFLPTPDFIPSDLFTLEEYAAPSEDPPFQTIKHVRLAPQPNGTVTRFLKYPDGSDSAVPLFSTDQQAIDPRYGFVTPVCRFFNTTSKPMPDGTTIDFWGFYDPKSGTGFKFPSDTIRIAEGQYFHGWLGGVQKKAHTIHWHGMEPTAQNDGVGKLSMEVGGDYVYQWLASAAGTYFYHCHRNTPLHFEMGMYGMLLIDPLSPKGDPLLPPYKTGGPGYVRYKNGLARYDAEAIWVTDDVDSRWHKIGGHGFGFGSCGGSALDAQGNPLGQNFTSLADNADPMHTGGTGLKGLHDFVPDHFFITGVPHPWTRNKTTDRKNPGTAVEVKAGQTLLVRLLCASYGINTYLIQGLDAEVIAMDGRVLGDDYYSRYNNPFYIPANVPWDLTAARRFDLLIRPTRKQRGTHLVVVEFKHHITRETIGMAETYIIVR